MKTQEEVESTYPDCVCVGDGSGSAVRQKCDNDCGYFALFALGVFIFIFLHFGIQTPTTMAVLKCVKEDQKSLALGLKRIIVGLLGSLPGPILLGYFIEQTCIFWMNGKNVYNVNYPFISFHILDKSDGGSCLLYDNYKFGVIICCCCIIAKFISIMFYFASIVLRNKKSSIPSKNADDKLNADAVFIHSSKTELPIFLNPLERSWYPSPPSISDHGHN